MGRPYVEELGRLSQTLSWVGGANIDMLKHAVAAAGSVPLIAVGSGGSLSAAHVLAFAHQVATGQPAMAVTPYQLRAGKVPVNAAIWLISAGGGNVDIVDCLRTVVGSEPRQVAVLCGKAGSKLAALATAHPFVDLIVHEPPSGKDGFLATNSLVAFSALVIRAYAEIYDHDWEAILSSALAASASDGPKWRAWESASRPVWERPTTIVLHGNSTRSGAIDLESKFTEAAIGNLHFADWRNFAHGRHHWLAKRAETSAVIAFVSQEDETMAAKTLALIPSHVPVCRIALDGPQLSAALSSLVAATVVTGWAGAARGIDPGRPGVPEFGRRLYHMPLEKRRLPAIGVDAATAAALARKTGMSLDELSNRGLLQSWLAALAQFKTGLLASKFGAVVLDYDGTVVDTRKRFEGPDQEMIGHLTRLLDHGVRLGIATGRGVSVRRDLRSALPRAHWAAVVVGYYNGGSVSTLDDDDVPAQDQSPGKDLADLSLALARQPELAASAVVSTRRSQVTLEPRFTLPEARLWDLARQVVSSLGAEDYVITRSSHSVDIVPRGISKRAVLDHLRGIVTGELLAIGDRGRWPGNDFELLGSPFALSVDEVSVDPATCWNLGRPGQRGPAVLLEYLTALKASCGQASFAKDHERKAG